MLNNLGHMLKYSNWKGVSHHLYVPYLGITQIKILLISAFIFRIKLAYSHGCDTTLQYLNTVKPAAL